MARDGGHMPVAGKIIILTVLLLGGYFLATKTGVLDKIAPKNQSSSSSNPFKALGGSNDDIINVGVVTWGGYAAGQYYNRGFQPSETSEFYKQYGLKVKFSLIDDFAASRAAFRSNKKGERVDVLWTTIDAFPTEVEGMSDIKPKVFFQADWSRGGDAIVVKPGINTAMDLVGKKVAVAFGTPSHTFILYTLEASDLGVDDVTLFKVADAIKAADAFIAGQVDAAVVWSPDDDRCVNSIQGSKVLMSTKTAKYIISDVFIAKADYIDNNRAKLEKFVKGWMEGAAELNAPGANAKQEQAANILADGLGQPKDFCARAISNVRLCTYGDNRAFFGLDPTDNMTGQRLYEKMTQKYCKFNMCSNPPAWSDVVDVSIISSLSQLTGMPGHEAEGKATYTAPTVSMKTATAITTKKVTVNFETGRWDISENGKELLRVKLGDILKMSTNRIRIEGNTDIVGSAAANVTLSQKRAEALATFLANDMGIDRNRFVVKGNGPNNPICDDNSPECYAKNRRTEIQMLEN